MSMFDFFKKLKCYLLVISLQFGFSGMYIIAVASLKRGMNNFALVVYRNAFATIFIAPFAFWLERKMRPKMTISCFLKIVALGLLEPVLDQNLYFMGAKLTGAGFSTALFNLLPAVTFLMAIILRMEKINLRELVSQAKIVGTIVAVGGALLMILYNGPILEFPWMKESAGEAAAAAAAAAAPSAGPSAGGGGSFIKGTIMVLFACCAWSAFFILQSHTLTTYPAELSLTAWICFMGTVESTIVTLVVERGKNPWGIGWDMRLVTCVYAGVICSGIAYYVQGIVMKERGPVFVTAFNPLCMIITAILGTFVLGETISLGKALGALVIVIGLYMLVWGKSRDFAAQQQLHEEKVANLELPITTATDVTKKGDLN